MTKGIKSDEYTKVNEKNEREMTKVKQAKITNEREITNKISLHN
jgi:hypothetical protein